MEGGKPIPVVVTAVGSHRRWGKSEATQPIEGKREVTIRGVERHVGAIRSLLSRHPPVGSGRMQSMPHLS